MSFRQSMIQIFEHEFSLLLLFFLVCFFISFSSKNAEEVIKWIWRGNFLHWKLHSISRRPYNNRYDQKFEHLTREREKTLKLILVEFKVQDNTLTLNYWYLSHYNQYLFGFYHRKKRIFADRNRNWKQSESTWVYSPSHITWSQTLK